MAPLDPDTAPVTDEPLASTPGLPASDDGYDFAGATFDLSDDADREVLCFILSQALFGEATGVYCGRSLYAARSLEAARFYTRQARQELGHLQLFADIFRALDLTPMPPHWVIRLLSSHNNYYPLKVLMEHAIGEGRNPVLLRENFDHARQRLKDSAGSEAVRTKPFLP